MDINLQIEAMAEKLEKSTKSERDILVDLVKELGSEGIKKAMPSLTETQQELLKSVLAEELEKSMKLDDKIITAPKIEGKLTDTKIQEEVANDDADEEIAAAAEPEVNHQGGEKQEGWEGQIIKGGPGSGPRPEGQLKQILTTHMDKFKDYKVGQKDHPHHAEYESSKAASSAAAKELDTHYSRVKKSEEENMNFEEVIKSMTEEQKAEFSSKLIAKGMDAKKVAEMMDKKIESSEKKDEKEDKKMIKEEVAEVKEPKKEEPKIEKAFSWEDPSRLLKACTLGRNFHYSVNDFYDEVLKKSQEVPATEELIKSDKETINDILAKGADCSALDVKSKKMMEDEKKKMNGQFQKSFEEVDMAQALGLTAEEAKKILGE